MLFEFESCDCDESFQKEFLCPRIFMILSPLARGIFVFLQSLLEDLQLEHASRGFYSVL